MDRRRLLLVAFVLALSRSTTASPPTSAVADLHGVGIHYLEWSHSGPAYVFVPGLGDTAWMMSGFASRFASAGRVIVMTRRGYGRSTLTNEGYDLATRVEDIRGLLDALNIRRAVLIGHSIAGDELSAFGARYPDRVVALVYLDAAYDRSDPEAPQPTASVWSKVLLAWLGASDEQSRRSLSAFRAAQRRTFFGIWTNAQEKNLRETTTVNVDGTVSSRTPPWVGRAISESDRQAKPSIPHVPALLVFARQRLELRGLALDAETKAGLIRDEEAYEAYFARYVERLRGRGDLQVEVLSQTMHHLYLEKPEIVEQMIRRYLSRLTSAGTLPQR